MARPYLRAATIGFVSGLRSMAGPAAARIRGGGPAAIVLPLLALGEIVADKLPGIPPRTAPVPLTGRAIAGGLAARRVAGDEADSRVAFALGAAAAVGAAFLAMRLRREAVARTGLPDPAIAFAEDVIAVALGALATA